MVELHFRANAKINLFLEVLDKRADGYHDIETIFQSIDLYDIIMLREGKSGVIKIRCDHPQVPLDSSNLVYKAAELLLKESRKGYGAEIRIIKKIPVGAGLGGGSADSAATLIGLNELWGLGYGKDDLIQLGSRLGADVPFCVVGGTSLGKGRGDMLKHLPPFPEVSIVIANPGFQVSTAWAYGNLSLTRAKKSANIFTDKIQRSDLSNIGDELFNIFESMVTGRYPVVQKLKENFIQSGALGALMTGSGPTVFAIAQDMSGAEYLRKQAKQIVDYCVITKTSAVSVTNLSRK